MQGLRGCRCGNALPQSMMVIRWIGFILSGPLTHFVRGQTSERHVPSIQDRSFDRTLTLRPKAVFPTIFNSIVVPRFGAAMSWNCP